MTKAAATLGIAQPALSRQLHRLEEQLGVKLFHRTARGMELTDEGERLRAGTAVPLRQLELAVRYADLVTGARRTRLRLGLLESTSVCWRIRCCPCWRRRSPSSPSP